MIILNRKRHEYKSLGTHEASRRPPQGATESRVRGTASALLGNLKCFLYVAPVVGEQTLELLSWRSLWAAPLLYVHVIPFGANEPPRKERHSRFSALVTGLVAAWSAWILV
eukprot:1810042-Amphidinium_carterae.1